MVLAPGDLFLGKYRIESVLGQGGMGGVFAARHVELGELCAIKIMLPKTATKFDAAERFLREAKIAAKLENEHTIRVFDVGRTEDGTLFMVMEHLVGMDLKAYLAQCGRLSWNEAITYVRQACESLAEAHEMGIVHRDIKPANLFLTRKRKTEKPQIKVLDFGVSKELGNGLANDLTSSAAMLGSPLYMSPEQMAHSREVDARTDIWSLGAVLYELIAGVVPFPGEILTQVVYRVTNREPEPIRNIVPDLPAALDAIITRCLQKDPARRYGRVEELSAALDEVLKDELAREVLRDRALADTVNDGAARNEFVGAFDTTEVAPQYSPKSQRSGQEKPLERASTGSHHGAVISNKTYSISTNRKLFFLVGLGSIVGVAMNAYRLRTPEDHQSTGPSFSRPLTSATDMQESPSEPSVREEQSIPSASVSAMAKPTNHFGNESAPATAKSSKSAAIPDEKIAPVSSQPNTESSGTKRKRSLL